MIQLVTDHPDSISGRLVDGFLAGDILFHQIVNCGAFDVLVDRGPAGNNIGFRRIKRFAGLSMAACPMIRLPISSLGAQV